MKYYILSILCIIALSATGQTVDTLNNDRIIKMVSSGVSKELIVKKIQISRNVTFDLTTDEIIRLKSKKVPDTVVLAMMDKQEKASLLQLGVSNVDKQSASIPNTEVRIKKNDKDPIKDKKKGVQNPEKKDSNDQRTLIQSASESIPVVPITTNTSSLKTGVYYQDKKSGELIALPANNSGMYHESSNFLGTSTKGYYVYKGKSAIYSISDPRPVFYLKIESNNSDMPTQMVLFSAIIKKGGRYIQFSKVKSTGVLGSAAGLAADIGSNTVGGSVASTAMGAADNVKISEKTIPGSIIMPIVERYDNTLYRLTFEKKLTVGNYFLAYLSGFPSIFCFEFDVK